MIDLLLYNARIVDVFRLRVFDGWVGIDNGRFIYVEEGEPPDEIEAREARDLNDLLLAPGLIDSHMHIESSLITPRRFAEAVLPWGTTTILSDPHEVGNVAGERGVGWMIEASSGLPLRVYHSIPSCVPATAPELEWTAQVFDADVIRRLARLPSVIALGEVMDYRGLLGASPRLQAIVAAARECGLLIEGHIPTLAGAELSAYLAHGVGSDHTLTFPAKINEQISKGLAVMLQTKSITVENVAAVMALPDRSRILLVTDDIEPTLLQKGHLSRMVQLAIEAGLPPLEALASASLRPARYLNLRNLGAIAPGYRADYLLLRDLAAFPPLEVAVGGQVVAREGAYTGPALRDNPPLPDYHAIPGPFAASDFRLAAESENGRARANVVALQTRTTTLTRLETLEVSVRDGYAVLEDGGGLALAAIIARDGRLKSVGLIKNTGFTDGAFASSVAHDSHNLLVIGRGVEAMARAANAVHEVNGGVAVADDNTVLALLKLPYFGLLSDAPAAAAGDDLAAVEAALAALGVDLARPFLTLSIMGLTVSPYVKFSDRGVVDTETRALLPAVER